MGQWLSDRMGQQLVIENRPGAAGNVGTEAAVRAAPDGYTLVSIGTPHAINVTLYDKLNFDLIKDIAPIAGIIRTPLAMLIHPSIPAKTVPEFIAYAKVNKGKINMASAGTGTPQHVSGELFKMMAGIEMAHVPYRGSAPALTDLLGGQIQFMLDTTPASIEHIRAGSLRALAVTTSARSPVLPDVPSLAEFLPGYEASAWYGLGARANTPIEVIERINGEVNAGLADPKLKAKLADLGGEMLPDSPAGFGSLIASEMEKWRKVVKFSGAKPE
jgi:tripartite-type tricarboxylate transporter receptor subunit TctC